MLLFQKNQLLFLYMWLRIIGFIGLFCAFNNAWAVSENLQNNQDYQNNAQFRQDVVDFVHDTAFQLPLESNINRWFYNSNDMSKHLIHWKVTIKIYQKGECIGKGKGSDYALSETLKGALLNAMHTVKKPIIISHDAQFKITFYYPPDEHRYIVINDVNNKNQAFELIGSIIPVYDMDIALLKNRIQMEKNYLLRMIDPITHAIFKKYDAKNDQRDTIVRTIYTASSLYTLLMIDKKSPDRAIDAQIKPMAKFLLMMQNKAGKDAGAFYYSYDLNTQQKDAHYGSGRFVVGTAAKTIFTLLLLYEKTQDIQYLEAAKRAGNWLLTKSNAHGQVMPVSVHAQGKIILNKKQSFLYSGQVLSALSRLYAVTHEKIYYVEATKIADRMVHYIQQKGAFVGDDFRQPNSVSTSWVVMSLLDYAKINHEQRVYQKVLFRSADALVQKQIHAPWDAYNDGRLMDIMTSSGNGWVNEVMTNLYPFCQVNKRPHCDIYRDYTIASSRWLIQNVYGTANSFMLKNPKMAEGGAIRNYAESAVRTDAVCHGLNSLMGLLNIVDVTDNPNNQMLRVLPEMPTGELMGLLQLG